MTDPNVVALRSANHPALAARPPIDHGRRYLIDCDDCCRQESSHCADCIVTHLTSPPVSGVVLRPQTNAVVIEADELGALRRLRDAGLVPDLQHRPVGSAG